MECYHDNVLRIVNVVFVGAVPGAIIKVLVFGTTDLATIYAVNDTGSTPIAGSAVTADAEGMFSFYAPNGRYTLQVYTGTTLMRELVDVLLFDPGDLCTMVIVNDATSNRTLVLTDACTNELQVFVRMTNGAGSTVTVPPHSSVAFPIGAVVNIRDAGGQVTMVAGSGVTLTPPFGGNLTGKGVGATWSLVQVATNSWDIFGQMVGT